MVNRGSVRVMAVCLLLSGAGCFAAPSQTPPTHALLTAETLLLPAFGDLPKGSRPGIEAEYERARSDTRFQLLKVTYPSDGLAVVAFVYGPSASRARLPVIVYNRGSYVRQNAAPDLLVTFHRLADAGFLVVAPMYRGSEGAPGRDEMGGADLADLIHVQAVIASLPYVDTANTFLYGESRGGMMTLQALRDGFPARAAAVVGTFTDLEQLLKEDPKAAAFSRQLWPDYEANHLAIAERRSAVRWADRITAPLLIMHGGDDTSVSPTHALQLAAALQRHGKPYELVIAAGAKHVLQPFEAERDERAVRWFRRHLGPRQ